LLAFQPVGAPDGDVALVMGKRFSPLPLV